MAIEFLLEDQSLGRKGNSEKASPNAFADFPVPTDQNYYTKTAYFGMAYSVTFHLLDVCFSASTFSSLSLTFLSVKKSLKSFPEIELSGRILEFTYAVQRYLKWDRRD